MKKIFALSFLLMTLLRTPESFASTFGCESVAGSVVLKDTFYGALTGSLLSGLYVLTQDGKDRRNSGRTISNGAAIGGALGLGLGITEVALRNCPNRLMERRGFHSTFAAMPAANGGLGAGLQVDWNF